MAELVELRRTMLRFARSLPLRSSDRNQRRQIAASLQTLFNDERWLDANTVEGSQKVAMDRYIHNANIEHYTRLLASSERDPGRDEHRHEMLLTLLADEMAKDQRAGW